MYRASFEVEKCGGQLGGWMGWPGGLVLGWREIKYSEAVVLLHEREFA